MDENNSKNQFGSWFRANTQWREWSLNSGKERNNKQDHASKNTPNSMSETRPKEKCNGYAIYGKSLELVRNYGGVASSKATDAIKEENKVATTADIPRINMEVVTQFSDLEVGRKVGNLKTII